MISPYRCGDKTEIDLVHTCKLLLHAHTQIHTQVEENIRTEGETFYSFSLGGLQSEWNPLESFASPADENEMTAVHGLWWTIT